MPQNTTVTTAAPASNDPRVLLVVGEHVHATERLPGTGRVVIGRAADCDIRIDDASISRSHATLDLDAPLRITDLRSANGTWVSGERLAPDRATEIELDQAIRLGAVTVIVQRRAHGAAHADAQPELVAGDARMRELHAQVAQVAAAEISVLLRGETGAGKEVFAERIHRGSPRAHRPFVKLNCAALSEGLLESELFGHERGAFTGAVTAKPGLLEVAGGGTVFFDEIGEMLPALQAKLLRVLDERKVLRVGALQPRAIDVRVVSATHRDLDADVRRGAFRQDLLYRLNAMTIVIPPLRERTAEILPLAARFLHDAAARARRATPQLSDAAAAQLVAHRWPGNIRELRNVIERALVLATSGVIDSVDLPAAAPPPPASADEREQILAALDACDGNQTQAAARLGISRRTLLNKLDKFSLPRPRKR